MSKNGTPFRGVYPLGWGGTYGQYATPEPSFNVNQVIVEGTQYKYVKQSVLSTRGMLRKKYRWAYNGQYPNYWVQPNYGGSFQSDTKSQGNYIHTVSTANDIVTDVNASDKYIGYRKSCGPTLCQTSTTRFTYNDMSSNGSYTKFIKNPQASSEHTHHLQRGCLNPVGKTKPFPYGTNGNTCNTGPYYLSPPEWYTNPRNNSLIA
jgi:hypothetical protein